jgi:hypothetical protein
VPSVLIGTSTSGRSGETARREAAAEASLAGLRGVDVVNLRFADEPASTGPVEPLAALRLDAPGVTGRKGPRKPVVSEMLDVLADHAARRGCPRIAVINGDISITQAGVERLMERAEPAIAVSRLDVGGGVPDAFLLRGVDMFVFESGFWRAHRRRFRPYILGEALWDNVYASVVVCHGGVLINREPVITHERHAAGRDSPFAPYGHLLATYDRAYFSRWCEYVAEAEGLRSDGGTIEDEYALQRKVFTPPGFTARAADRVRGTWWRLRHRFS